MRLRGTKQSNLRHAQEIASQTPLAMTVLSSPDVWGEAILNKPGRLLDQKEGHTVVAKTVIAGRILPTRVGWDTRNDRCCQDASHLCGAGWGTHKDMPRDGYTVCTEM